MGWPLTLANIALALGLFLFASYRANKPADPLKPRLIPWRLVLIASGFWGLLIAIHAVNLLGFKTGQNSPFGAF